MTGINHNHAKYIPVLFNNFVWFFYWCKGNDETAIMTQNLHVHITAKAGDMTQSR
jgi:hypothetical protein